ncbi:MAG: hypothetical protein OXG53_07805 [Chloroflexi bacterium]|nr:hypothetical protein [Chloroflexota bacterium]
MTKAGGASDPPRFQLSDFQLILGEHGARMVWLISHTAREQNLALYLAGGLARDLLLRRRTLDFDFAVEGDAISFARSLAITCGGRVEVHKSFGTAKWILDNSVTYSPSLVLDELPASIDFVAARRETYAHPAALPNVTPGDMESDLQRRDFSVNALAIQVSPLEEPWPLVDVCDGKADLDRGLIRALHDQSFVDDPTRILRALRYAERLGFELESNTAEWMRAALPYLGQVTGQRLRNEIDLILREPLAGEMLLRLQELGALASIHPAFRISPQLPDLIARCESLEPPWSTESVDGHTLRWMMLMSSIGSAEARDLCERLALTNRLKGAITASTRLREGIRLLEDPDIRPSRVAQNLDVFPEAALLVGWLLAAETPTVQELIAKYASDWRQRRPTISGEDLKAMGLAPGPRYRQLLDRLRFAWIDGEVGSAQEEAALLRQLLDEGS